MIRSLTSRKCCQRTRPCGATRRLKCISFTHTSTFPPENLGAVSDEDEERFHQDIAQFKKIFRVVECEHVAEYCLPLVEELQGTRGKQALDEGLYKSHLL
ncbi:hypothetical protein AVEN_154464-1 [Araneus ventricosus]|uniref:Uncharacterized protein n=1 Tax=Araneus ventricosus TaxID=182803 RepID=A0A4Y2TX22_ARAVE|nr:hypothetical protein AVEN_154464-1 [Araneus ventricosus]